jgi:hypothetical protein
MKTDHDRLVEALIALGAEAFGLWTQPYTKLTRPGGEPGFYFVGKRKGDLRVGEAIDKSRPAPRSFRAKLLAASKED